VRDIFLCFLLLMATALAVGYTVLVAATIHAGSKFGCSAWIVTAIVVGLFFSIVTFVGHQAGVSMAGFFNG
jgi:hypothetical protein